jgi:acetyl esterase/lipase
MNSVYTKTVFVAGLIILFIAEDIRAAGVSNLPGMACSGVETKKTVAGNAYSVVRDVRYAGTAGAQLLDLYRPEPPVATLRPVVVIIHGGGWAVGDKADAREREFAALMMDEGYVAVSINYTMTAYEGEAWKSPRVKGSWPQNICDCKSALAWLVKNAVGLGIDTNRLAIMGGSAGGHLALLTGLSNGTADFGSGCNGGGKVRCIVDFYGIPDVRRWGGWAFVDESETEHPEIWASASPVEHLSACSPPILIVHGTVDKTVDVKLSDEFADILKAKGLPYEYVKVPGAGHAFGLHPPGTGVDLGPVVQKFLRTNL